MYQLPPFSHERSCKVGLNSFHSNTAMASGGRVVLEQPDPHEHLELKVGFACVMVIPCIPVGDLRTLP